MSGRNQHCGRRESVPGQAIAARAVALLQPATLVNLDFVASRRSRVQQFAEDHLDPRSPTGPLVWRGTLWADCLGTFTELSNHRTDRRAGFESNPAQLMNRLAALKEA